jgi:hypothetical protein
MAILRLTVARRQKSEGRCRSGEIEDVMTRDTCCSFLLCGTSQAPRNKKLSSVVDRLGRWQDTFEHVTPFFYKLLAYMSMSGETGRHRGRHRAVAC